jgi:hypothetical protein
LRRMILQLRQIFLTDAETFMVFSLIGLRFSSFSSGQCWEVRSLRPEHDASTTQVVGGQFNGHFVSRQDADVVHPHLAGNMPEHYMAVFQFDPEGGVGEVFDDLPLHLNNVVFRHTKSARYAYSVFLAQLALKFSSP